MALGGKPVNLTEYVRILARRGWIMLLLAVIAGGSAYFLSREQEPVYRASQVVLIQPSRFDLGITEASVRLLNSLAVYIDTETIAQSVIEDLKLDMTPGELKSNVTIAPDQLRLTIQIDVDNKDPKVASDVALAWGRKLEAYRNEQNQLARREDRVNAIPIDFPAISQKSPRPKITGAAGAILGLLVGGVIVFMLEYLESSVVRRSEELERMANAPVLASIPNFDS
jgi:capsular polysaccharide biosynthesis protein